ncbi:HNH endonuclease [Roseobacter litoralis]|uniref:HNH endonuclease n=1 Tax=Roseobacter litoralis TaxID=42443 RepID=UPI002493CB00|nr:HNH endonuclease [Roseobacter litoralis]
MQWWQSVEKALQNIGSWSSLEQLYDEVRKVRAAENDSIPVSLEAIVRKELEYNSSDSSNFNGRRDIFFSVEGIGKGIWGLRSLIVGTPIASDIDDSDAQFDQTIVYRRLRDTKMTKRIKAIHNYACQICGEWITLPDGGRYAEAHHVKPLGQPHFGPDVASNILVVCPNHHAMLDYRCMELKGDELRRVSGHFVDQKYLDYHNNQIVSGDVSKL